MNKRNILWIGLLVAPFVFFGCDKQKDPKSEQALKTAQENQKTLKEFGDQLGATCTFQSDGTMKCEKKGAAAGTTSSSTQ